MNTQQQSELKVFSSRATRREKSLGSEFKFRRNSNSVTNKHHQQRRVTQVKVVPLQNIKTRHKIKHTVKCEMGQEHLIKTITHSW